MATSSWPSTDRATTGGEVRLVAGELRPFALGVNPEVLGRSHLHLDVDAQRQAQHVKARPEIRRRARDSRFHPALGLASGPPVVPSRQGAGEWTTAGPLALERPCRRHSEVRRCPPCARRPTLGRRGSPRRHCHHFRREHEARPADHRDRAASRTAEVSWFQSVVASPTPRLRGLDRREPQLAASRHSARPRFCAVTEQAVRLLDDVADDHDPRARRLAPGGRDEVRLGRLRETRLHPDDPVNADGRVVGVPDLPGTGNWMNCSSMIDCSTGFCMASGANRTCRRPFPAIRG